MDDIVRGDSPQYSHLAAAIERGYLDARRDSRIARAYWDHAERRGLPVVTVCPRRLYASISADMVVAKCRLDAQAMQAIDRLRTSDRRGCYDTGRYHVGYAHLARIPIVDADRVAGLVRDIAMECIARHQREAVTV